MRRRKVRAAIMVIHRERHAAHSAGCSLGLEAAPDKETDGAAVRRHNVGLQPIKLHASRKPDERFQQELADASALIVINDT
jgi:hypothetical protein